MIEAIAIDLTWAEFSRQFEATATGDAARVWQNTTKHFQRICQPGQVAEIDEATLHHFVTVRLTETDSRRAVQKQIVVIRHALKHGFDAGLVDPSRFAVKRTADGQWRWRKLAFFSSKW